MKDLYASYKDFPVILYQVQTKFRDEARPRAGLLRGREFLMKDSYSFDLSDEGLAESYRKHREAYIKIFDRLGLDYTIVVGHVGRDGWLGLGGVPGRRAGRRGHVRRLHRLRLRGQHRGGDARPAPPAGRPVGLAGDDRARHARTRPTIETLVDLANAEKLGGRADWTAADTLKNVVLKVTAARRASRSCSSSACPATARST